MSEPLSPERLAEIDRRRQAVEDFSGIFDGEIDYWEVVLNSQRDVEPLRAEVDRLTRENAELRAKVGAPRPAYEHDPRCAGARNYEHPCDVPGCPAEVAP